MTSNLHTLPFTVKIAMSESDILEAVRHRSAAYSKELPELGTLLRQPEPFDERAPGRELIIARSRLDGGVIGSIRLHLNYNAPLPLERCIDLPERLRGKRLIEATRLAVSGGLVCRSALFKALLHFAWLHGVEECVVAARPRISIIHESLGFADLFLKNQTFPIPYANNLEHRVMTLPMVPLAFSAIALKAMKPSLHDFFLKTNHSDIDISNALSLAPLQ